MEKTQVYSDFVASMFIYLSFSLAVSIVVYLSLFYYFQRWTEKFIDLPVGEMKRRINLFYGHFILEKIIFFWHCFSPEKLLVEGKVIDAFTKVEKVSSTSILNEGSVMEASIYFFDVTYYYIQVWNPLTDILSLVEVDKKAFKKAKRKLKHLDASISILCNKYSWSEDVCAV